MKHKYNIGDELYCCESNPPYKVRVLTISITETISERGSNITVSYCCECLPERGKLKYNEIREERLFPTWEEALEEWRFVYDEHNL